MKLSLSVRSVFATFVVLFMSLNSFGQLVQKVNYNLEEVTKSEVSSFGILQIQTTNARYYKMDVDALRAQMQGVAIVESPGSGFVAQLVLPHPDGSLHSYEARQNLTMHPGLAALFPEIRAYDGVNLVEGINVKWDITPHGLHAMIFVPGESTIFIDPAIKGNDNYYVVYHKKDFVTDKVMECGVESLIKHKKDQKNNVIKSFGSCELRTYRLALAATGEYTAFHGGTVALAQAAQVTTMNRVNGVYEREMQIRMTIISNNNLIIYTNGSTDPYTNNNGGTMLNENQNNCTSVIGSANYDIGHVFSTGGGGIAQLYSPCNSTSKAKGVTGSPAPIGDPFDIDYVAHEVGHQFGANHTFNNSNNGSCSGNANTSTSFEPGSGSTIMAYAGICSPTNVQNNSDDYFHTASLQEIGTFITGGTHTCPVKTTLANASPTVTASAASINIPKGTPFFLTATATDPNSGDVLTYCWEQYNAGTSTTTPSATATSGANFRSFDPTTSPTRYFPSLSALAANGPFTWEVLPTVARTMNFRVTVRDNAPGGGCNDEDAVAVNVASSGPFTVTYPTATGVSWVGATSQTVTWNVAGTTASPVSCANVDILISTDGGATYTVLVSNTPNDGTQTITVPNTPSSTCRIMVRCNGGYFFDISNNNFTITAATFDYTLTTSPTTATICQPSNATFNISVGSIGGYNSPVTLSVSGVPAGATSNFSVNPVTPVGSSVLTISNTSSAAPGTYSLTITATSAAGTKTNNVTLNISSSAPTAVSLTSPTNGATGVSIPSVFSWGAVSGTGVTYEIQIGTDAGFSSITDQATGLTTTNYTSSLLATSTTYYWRVRAVSGCGTGPWSTSFNFTTGTCSTTSSTNVPVNISPTGTPTVTSTITVPTGGSITDVNVLNLVGSHTYLSDLLVTLTSPSGTTITLFNGICTSLDNFNMNFDDAGTAYASIACPPTTGATYHPSGNLSTFNGQNPAGTWTLSITDQSDQDGGALTSWALQICVSPSCTNPTTPTLSMSPATVCQGQPATLNITGTLNSATNWSIYTGSCGGTLVGTTTTSTFSIPSASNATYYVRGEDGAGCLTEASLPCASLMVTTNTVPAAPSTSVTNNCGNSVLSTTGASPVWSTGATTSSITVTSSGSYTVTQTVGGCTSAPATVTAAPLAIPTVNAGDDQNVCAGQSVILTGSGASTYSWNNGVTNGTPFTPASTLTYTVIGASSEGCTNTDQVIVTVDPVPSIVMYLSPANGSIGVAIPTTFTWNASGTSGVTYSIEVATDAGFTNIVAQSTGLSTTSYNTSVLNPNTTYYWHVQVVGACGASGFGSAFSFTTDGCMLYSATDVPIAISASGTPTITSTITVPTGGTINDVNVIDLNGTHTWIKDLIISLTSPSGTTVILMNQVCNNQNDFDLNYDDAAATATVPCPPIGGGTYIPNQLLAAFNGEDAAGDWVLTVQDVENQDGGSLSGWSLQICVTPTVCNDPTTPTLSMSPATICEGQSAALTITGALNSSTNWSVYTGSCGGTLVGTTTTSTFTIPSASSTTYYVRGEDGAGCVNEASIPCASIVVNATPTPSAPTATVADNCGSSVLTTTGTNPVWSTGATSSSITVTTAGAYTVTQTVGGCTSAATSVTAAPLAVPSAPIVTVADNCGNSVLTATGTNLVWSTGATTSSITVTTAGTYTVTQTSGGCTSAPATGTAAPLAVPSIATGTVTNPSTCGTATGSVQITGSGTGNLTWTGTASGSATGVTLPYTVTGLAAGSYNFVFTNACSSAPVSATITDPSAPSAPTVTVTNNCGNSVLTATGSNPVWSTGATTASITVTTAGTYTVTQSVGGCTSAPASVTAAPLVVPSAPTATVADNCGSSVLTTTGTNPVWSTGATSSSITVTTAGAYTVTQTVGGCTSAATSVTAAPLAVPSAPVVTVVNNCGSSELSATGTNLVWSTGATTASITVTTAGSYTVTQTSGGCTSTPATGTVAPLVVPSIATGTISNPSTCGTASGSVQITGSGTGNLTWTGTASGTATGVTLPYTVNGLTVGSYDFVFTNSCPSAPVSTIIADPSAPSAPTITVTNNCGNSVMTTTGSNPVWSTGATTSSITVTTAGTYTVTQSVGGCTSAPASATAAPLAPPSAPTVTVVNNCGSSVLTTTGTNPVWSTGATTSSITVAAAGTYTVTQTVGGCTSAPAIATAAPLVPPSAPTVTVVNNCGSSVLTTTGTNPVWSTGATTSSITVAAAGTYTVTQTVGGCTSSPESVTAAPIAIPSAPTITVTNNCGNSVMTTTGSNPVWSTGATTSLITVTTAGTYTVTQSVGGCTSDPASATATPFAAPSAPTATVTNNCGSSVLTTTGTNPVWSTGATTSSITVAAAGTYTVTQTIGGCTSTPASVTAAPVAVPEAPTVIVENNCGSSLLSAIGSNLVWSTGEASASITVTTAGDYYVSQTIGGCTSATGIGTASPLSIPNVVLSPLADVCINAAPFQLSGGSPFGGEYVGTGVTNNVFDPSVSGYGTFLINYSYTDANSCSGSAQQTITVGCADLDETTVSYSLYPNPTNGQVNISLSGIELRSVYVYDAAGRLVKQYELNTIQEMVTLNLSDLASGTYAIDMITDQNVYRERILINH